MTNLKQRTWNPTIALDAPLRWRKAYLVTLDVDLFDGMSDEQVAAVFGVMAACQSSIFRVWTAYPKRAWEFYKGLDDHLEALVAQGVPRAICSQAAECHGAAIGAGVEGAAMGPVCPPWPLRNVWLGIIARMQAELDERALDILACPAAMHWLRLVLHERVERVHRWLPCPGCGSDGSTCHGTGGWRPASFGHIDVSGAIGKDAPPCDIEWIREVIRQGRGAGVPVYVRGIGSNPWVEFKPEEDHARHWIARVTARNGDRPCEWPYDLRVREWPKGVEVDE